MSNQIFTSRAYTPPPAPSTSHHVGEIEFLMNTIRGLKGKINDLTVQNTELRGRVKELQESYMQSNKRAASRQEYLDDAYKRIEALESVIAGLEVDIKFNTQVKRAKGKRPVGRSMLPVDEIVNIVCNYFGLKHSDIQVRCRKGEIVYCRHMLIFVLAEYTNIGTPEIARIAGLSNHTSALHGIEKMKMRLMKNKLAEQHVSNIIEIIQLKQSEYK